MLERNLNYLLAALIGGIIACIILASTLPILPYGIALGDGAFSLLILLTLIYLLKAALHSIEGKKGTK